MTTVKQISDYVIFRCKSEGDTDLSVLKHQKLLYYIQAWFLAFYGFRLFDSTFEAWIHGPVSREIYDLYKEQKYLYSEMNLEDITNKDSLEKLSSEIKLHVDSVLDAYGKFSAIQLEIMTHQEEPWLEARKGYAANERCEVPIDPHTMQRYYASRL